MKHTLPISVLIDGIEHKIRNNCDFRVVLDCMNALGDESLDLEDRVRCALFIFYEDVEKIKDLNEATKQMYDIINLDDNGNDKKSPKIMDWEHDFNDIVSPINKSLGYECRTPDKFTHWWTFLSAFYEITGECTFATIISIRRKRMKGKKLEKWEEEYYRENKHKINLPTNLTEDEQEWFESDW